MKYFIILLSLFVSSPAAWAAWASGGGQIHGDDHNPWFLENTTTVSYCIDIDEEHFGVTKAEAGRQVKAAIDDWLSVLMESDDDYYQLNTLIPFGQIRLGTQTFRQYPCFGGRDIDLRFQLGQLTDEQGKLFSNPKEYIGIAVRTDYDKSALRGKGFIYLAPVTGPLTPNHQRLHPHAWTKEQSLALKMVLRHELGHVFGIEHQLDSLMDEKWPELFVDREFLDGLVGPVKRYLERRGTVRRLFGFTKDRLVEECGDRNPVSAMDIFNKEYSETGCGRITFKNDQLTIAFKPDANGTYEVIGTASFTGAHSNSSPAVSLYLPEGQRVFTKLPDEAKHLQRLFGERKITSFKWNSQLRIEATGELLPLQIESNSDSVSGTVVKANKFRNDAFFLE